MVAFPTTLPSEFNVHPYVDYAAQYDKAFVEPLTSITNIIKWKLREEATLEGLFE